MTTTIARTRRVVCHGVITFHADGSRRSGPRSNVTLASGEWAVVVSHFPESYGYRQADAGATALVVGPAEIRSVPYHSDSFPLRQSAPYVEVSDDCILAKKEPAALAVGGSYLECRHRGLRLVAVDVAPYWRLEPIGGDA